MDIVHSSWQYSDHHPIYCNKKVPQHCNKSIIVYIGYFHSSHYDDWVLAFTRNKDTVFALDASAVDSMFHFHRHTHQTQTRGGGKGSWDKVVNRHQVNTEHTGINICNQAEHGHPGLHFVSGRVKEKHP